MAAGIRAGATDAKFDSNGDGTVDSKDLGHYVEATKGTWIGDSNLDGEFNSSDFVAVFAAGEYEDADDGNSTWAEGDWNGDGDFNSSDFVAAFSSGGYEKGPRPEAALVPEPSGVIMLLLGLLHLRRRIG